MGKKWLDIVYNEKSSVRLKEHYKNWASKYDNDLIDWGYAYPTHCLLYTSDAADE